MKKRGLPCAALVFFSCSKKAYLEQHGFRADLDQREEGDSDTLAKLTGVDGL